MKPLILGACLVLAAAPAVAQSLADGSYGCMIDSYFLGEIAISANNYAGPAYDGAFGEWYPFETVGGTINWGGPLGGITAAGTVVSTVLTDAGNNQTGFDVTLQNDNGNFQTVSCYPAW